MTAESVQGRQPSEPRRPRPRISHYELLEPIVRDGTSEIYRARDLRLQRDVAVKLLRPEEIARPGAVELFRRQAQVASLVSHPHICAIHDSGEDAGQPFLVCELLEGRPLDALLAGGPLPPDRLLDIAIQVADALSAVHRRGLIHGSVKPANVFITIDGHVKLLELGATTAALTSDAKNEGSDPSRTTAIEAATPAASPPEDTIHAYLAPEYIAGHGIDTRSDVFAAGALIYEMATGTRAFRGDTAAALSAAIVAAAPARPRTISRSLPAAIESVIMRALSRDPAGRYQTGGELLDDLRDARRAVELPGPSLAGARFGRGIAAGVLVAAIVMAIGVTGALRGWWRSAPPPPVERSAVLVSHIANGTADPDFDGTLREAVTVYLAQSPYLDLVSDERVRSTLQLMGRDPSARMTHDVAEEVCQRLGLSAMLEGSVAAVGSATVVALVATDCSSGATVARQQIEVGRKEEVLGAVGRVTAEIRKSLGESGTSLARHNVPIEEATTPSLEALKAYTEGTARRAAGSEMDAIPFLERAIALDPRFALAHTTLSAIYGGLGETGRSEQFARLAYENREHVSERERLFITYQYHDRVTGDQLKARETLEVWKRTYPRDYRPANALAVLLLRLGDYDRAALEAEEAVRRNPSHAFPYSNLAYANRGAGRYGEARQTAQQTVTRGIETLPTRRLLYQLAVLQNDDAATRAQLDWAAKNPRGFDIVGAQAQVEAFHGRMTAARRLYHDTMASATTQGFRQVASGYASQAALTEAMYGYSARAIVQAREIVRSSTAYEPQLRAAVALALAGAPDEAEVLVRRLRGVRPEDTLLHGAYLPSAEAAVLLRRGRTDAALEQLRAATRYERGIVAALLPAYLRGVAKLRSKNPADAIEDFRTVLDNRGADPFSPVIPLSRLGLARALSASGRRDDANRSYEGLFADWSTADPDLPLLLEARKEHPAP
jgi:serine/threonine protein kinase/tetratricopeptide (TPR) repeat protein